MIIFKFFSLFPYQTDQLFELQIIPIAFYSKECTVCEKKPEIQVCLVLN